MCSRDRRVVAYLFTDILELRADELVGLSEDRIEGLAVTVGCCCILRRAKTGDQH